MGVAESTDGREWDRRRVISHAQSERTEVSRRFAKESAARETERVGRKIGAGKWQAQRFSCPHFPAKFKRPSPGRNQAVRVLTDGKKCSGVTAVGQVKSLSPKFLIIDMEF